MQITNHTDLIQALIDKHGLKSYLEIGVNDRTKNFDKIKCDFKKGIEPAPIPNGQDIFYGTSDQAFEYLNKNKENKFSIVFIDGLHEKEQVKKDFENSMDLLEDNGFIIVHDVLPEVEETTGVPRATRCWHGTVYQWAMTVRKYDNIAFITYNIDEGCMLICKAPGKRGNNYDLGEFKSQWEQYQQVGGVLLNVVNEVII